MAEPLEASVKDPALPLPVADGTESVQGAQEDNIVRSRIPVAVSRRLYISHFLSTWNFRSFEFGIVLFLANIFPGTLLPLSIYALVSSAAAILFAPTIGRVIDRRGRLPAVRFSIIGGRLSVIVSCILCWGMYIDSSITSPAKWGIFSVLTLLSFFEKPCSILNMVAVERDWVVVISEKDEESLRTLNARMRRIDLFCKLAGPLFIALIDGASPQVAMWMSVGCNVISFPIEYLAIAQVYKAVPLLKESKNTTSTNTTDEGWEQITGEPRHPLRWIRTLYQIFIFYFQHSVFLPSFALALLYFTVLSFGGQMITYLIAVGYTSFDIALVRTLSVVFELSATWIAPRVMKRIDPARAGMWFLSWQMLWLGGAVIFFWAVPVPIISASGLAGGTILSRIGLWGYDLCAQFIIQEEVKADSRGSFSSTEASFQNAFELLSYVLTIVFSQPNEFRYPVIVSAGAVYMAGLLFAKFLRQRRGHLVHMPACVKRAEFDDS